MLYVKLARATLVAALVIAGTMGASAATITKVVDFSANSFVDGSLTPGVAPVDPVMGQFTITLDPALTASDETSGIALDSLNITLGSSLAYNYDPLTDRLEVGGLATGADTVTFSPAQNDFWLFINDFLSGTPIFEQVGYAQVSFGNEIFFTLDGTGSVTVSDPAPSVPAVPLPASLPLLLAALGGAAILRRPGRNGHA